jgi:hypothetical protein
MPQVFTLPAAFDSPLHPQRRGHHAAQDEEITVLREQVGRISQQLDVLSCLSSLSALACLVDLPLISTGGDTQNSREEPRSSLLPPSPPPRCIIHLGSRQVPLPDSAPLLSSRYPHIEVQKEVIDLTQEYANALVVKERLARELTARSMAQRHATTRAPEPAEAQDVVRPQLPTPPEQEPGPRNRVVAVPLEEVSAGEEQLIGALMLGDSRHRLPQDASRVKEWEVRGRIPVLKAFRHDALRQSLVERL